MALLKKLDRYILKQYLGTFVYTVLVLVTIICVIDFTEKNDNFIENKAPWDRVLIDYYLNLYPFFINLLSPILVFVSTILVTAQLAAKTEIIAILSSGVSFLRLLRVYAIGAIFLGILNFIMIGWLIPKANKTRVNFEVEYLNKQYNFDQKNFHMAVSENTYAYLERYNNQIDVGYRFTLETMKNNKIVSRLTSDRINWDAENESWQIRNYAIRTLTKDGDESLIQGKNLDTTINMNPSDFRSQLKKNETLNLTELEEYITELSRRGLPGVDLYIREKYERYTYPFAMIILTLIGVIMSARKSREGIGFQILMGFVLAFAYIIFVLVGRNFTESEFLHPLFNAWLPNIIFSFIGIFLYRTIPK